MILDRVYKVAGVLLVSSLVAQGARGEPKVGGLTMNLILQAEELTLGEPVMTDIEMKNYSHSPRHLDLGRNREGAIVVDWNAPSGKSGKSQLMGPIDDFFESGEISIGPGDVFRQTIVLNRWISFSEVGVYAVKMSVPLSSEEARYLVASASVRIEPPDRERLQDACRNLASKAVQGSPEAGRVAAEALRFASDEVCIESLARVMKESFVGRLDAIRGLAAIGSERAVLAVAEEWRHLSEHSKRIAMGAFREVGLEEALRVALQEQGQE